ncbi:MAG: L-2-hydroxyglutarate oxidase [Candidatus Omnitrophica bacterium]|nr:L-2-hydroxyglutarate oxidase [Candidatus Omnitrophota bacterium]
MNDSMRHVIVIGGGIVGLAVARELLLRDSSLKVSILEKDGEVGSHQTGRNSGVIHSGIYYPPGSLKAELCREGMRLIEEFCDRHHIQRRVRGKVIVAVKEAELPFLEKLYERGKANQIPDVRMISAEELKEIEPAITGIKALHLPHVPVVDFQKVAAEIRQEFESMGGRVFCRREVTAIHAKGSKITVKVRNENFIGSYLINCAGLYCDRIAAMAGCKSPVRIIPFRGEYYRLNHHWASKVRGLVYPVPDPRFPFLGVHLTPVITGEVKVGPNAMLALARQGYAWYDINLRDIFSMFLYPGFWKMSIKYWRMGLVEMSQAVWKPLYVRSVKQFLPGVPSSALIRDNSGVRAQAVDQQGNLVQDFLYLQQPNATHILNAPSPAATASFAIAKKIVDLIPQSRGFFAGPIVAG